MAERINFAERVWLEEYLDGPCSYEELRDCLRDLSRVNRIVFAHRPILEWLERVADSHGKTGPSGPLRIVDVGCGYGDMLRRIEHWAECRGLAVELIGVDINANAVRAAREATPAASRIQFIQADVTSCLAATEADLVTSCGVMHHLTEAEIVRMLQWMEETSRVGWFICDLHRQPVPYHVFNVMIRLGRWHRFIRPDGLRSIRRSFLAEDWQRMCAASGLDAAAVTIAAYRPARLCVERMKQAVRSKAA
jgi:2-polyprenyl-3-methyl-5-hydroxy-6-metoxy-1,4-benzoquinol methylase